MTRDPLSTLLSDVRETNAVEMRRAAAKLKQRMLGRPAAALEIGRYRLLEEVGSGGMGTVWAAHDPELDRRVAVKLLVPTSSAAATANARLVREAQAMAKLAHVNVLPVFDAGADSWGDQEIVFIVMELVDGADLRDWLAEGTRAPKQILDVFLRAGRGLAAAHDVGIIHRDFKPSNVLVDKGGRVLVADFGLAKAASPDEVQTSDEAPIDSSFGEHWRDGLTETGVACGTPLYMAPEQHLGQAVDARADQYAFCVALYEALFRVRPFTTGSLHQLIQDKRSGPAPPAPNLGRLETAVLGAVERGLRPDPDDRWPSMAALLKQLQRRPRRGLWVAAAGVGLAVALFSTGDTGRCVGANPLDAGWGPARRAEVAATFEAADAPFADRSHARVERGLDAYAADWTKLRREACSASVDDRAAERTLRCLDRAAAGVAALTRVLADDPAMAAENGPHAVRSLAALDRCAFADPSQTNVDELSPTEASAVARHGEALARAKALADVDRHVDSYRVAAAELEQIAAGSEAVQRLRIDALLLAGTGAAKTGDAATAVAHLTEALDLARAAGDSLAIWRSAVRVADITAGIPDRANDAERWLREAQSVESRIDVNDRMRAFVLGVRARLLADAGDVEGSMHAYREAVERCGMGSNRQPLVANLAVALHKLGDNAQAVTVLKAELARLREELGPDHPRSGNLLVTLAQVHLVLLRHEDVLEIGKRALPLVTAAHGGEHESVAKVERTIAQALFELHRYEESMAHAERALAILEPQAAQEPIGYADALQRYAKAASALGRGEAAYRACQRAEALIESTLPGSSTHTTILLATGETLKQLGRHAEALVAYRRARSVGPERGQVERGQMPFAATYFGEAQSLQKLGRHAEALVALGEIQRFAMPAQHTDNIPAVLAQRGLSLMHMDKIADARKTLEDAYVLIEGRPPSNNRGNVAFLYGAALWLGGDKQRGRELAAEALEVFEEAGLQDRVDVVREWLRAPGLPPL